jgi:hypothetical protein
MALKVEDLEDQTKYRQILSIQYSDLIDFVLEYIRKKTGLMVFFWSTCLFFLGIAITVRLNIAGYFPIKNIIHHSILGLIIFPLLSIPLHESFHIVPFIFTGAKKIRIGADLKQYIFYVTAHRHVATSSQFRFVAFTPFIIISLALLFLIFFMPGLWKWSLSSFLFVHTTMCAGDFAFLNFFWINRHKKIYTWDDADQKMAYFYEEI